MDYSVYDPIAKCYRISASHYKPEVEIPPDYAQRRFVNWTEVYVNSPNDVYPVGTSELPVGIVVHPDEIHQSACSPEKDLLVSVMLFLGVWGAKKLFTAGRDWVKRNA